MSSTLRTFTKLNSVKIINQSLNLITCTKMMQMVVAILLMSLAKGAAGQLSFCAQSSSPIPVATMCKHTKVIGNHVVIDVTDAGKRMVNGINACTCYLTPVITKEKARLYVLKQSSLEPGYNGCGSRIDVIIDSTQESGVIRNVCFLNGSVELQNNTIGNISFVKEFHPHDDRYCIGLRSDDSGAKLQVQCFVPGEEAPFPTRPPSTTGSTSPLPTDPITTPAPTSASTPPVTTANSTTVAPPPTTTTEEITQITRERTTTPSPTTAAPITTKTIDQTTTHKAFTTEASPLTSRSEAITTRLPSSTTVNRPSTTLSPDNTSMTTTQFSITLTKLEETFSTQSKITTTIADVLKTGLATSSTLSASTSEQKVTVCCPVFTTEITTIGTPGIETQSSQKQSSSTIGHITKTTSVTNKEQLDTGSENAAIIATSVILPVIFFVLLVLALMIFVRRKRRNSSQHTSEQKYLPSVDKLVQESAKENRDILNLCHSNKDNIDTIEDDEGYLKSSPLRKICNLPYTKSPTSLVSSKEEDENISPVYLYILD